MKAKKTPPALQPVPPPPPAPMQLALDARDAALAIGRLSLRSLRRGVAAGRIPPPRKIGGRAVWDVPELQAWLAAGCPAVNGQEPGEGAEVAGGPAR